METTANKMTDSEYCEMLQVWVNEAVVTAAAAVEAYEAEAEKKPVDINGKEIKVGQLVRGKGSKIVRRVTSFYPIGDSFHIVADRIDGSFVGADYVKAWRSWMSPSKLEIIEEVAA